MKMFHGTVDKFVPSIKKEGLRPSPTHAWRVAWDDGSEIRDSEPVDSVYLTKSKRHAIQYAETRVRYFAAKPGDSFPMFDAPHFFLTKDLHTEVIQVKPVLIIVEIDDHDAHLEGDPHDPYNAMRFVGHIPSSHIVEIVSLSLDLLERVDQRYDRSFDPLEDFAQLLGAY